jgi:hypothetical protein
MPEIRFECSTNSRVVRSLHAAFELDRKGKSKPRTIKWGFCELNNRTKNKNKKLGAVGWPKQLRQALTT